jgi:hypothetical protein
MMYRSEEINLISDALAVAQGSYKPLIPNINGAGGKYANLQAILDATREALSKNKLAFYRVTELLDEGTGAQLLKTTLSHGSGQFISSAARIISCPTFKETFNALEVIGRSQASLLLGIAPSPHDPLLKDDNGEDQLEKVILQDIRKPEEAKKRTDFVDRISKDQYDILMYELEGFSDIAKGIQTKYGIDTLADLPKTEYYPVETQIRKIKKTHEDYIRKSRPC